MTDVRLSIQMNKAGKIVNVSPGYAVPGGEITVDCEDFTVDAFGSFGCYVGGSKCRMVGASAKRIVAIVPDDLDPNHTRIYLESGGEQSESYEITVGRSIVENMHIVANPAVDPKDDSIIVTRSGGRGEQLAFTLYRIEADGYLDEMPAQVMNPTGVAFDPNGDLYVTNRSDGEVVRVNRGEEVTTFASGLGIATGIAFDKNGVMYVGDRSGTIFQVSEIGTVETFAVLEPSVAAFHLAFGPDDRLYVTSPGFASYDAVYAIDAEGNVEKFFRGLGRPQGLAFDTDGNLYVAGCYGGCRGIVRISPDGKKCEHFAAANAVGLCFTRHGEMIVATNDAAYSIPAGIYGSLLK